MDPVALQLGCIRTCKVHAQAQTKSVGMKFTRAFARLEMLRIRLKDSTKRGYAAASVLVEENFHKKNIGIT